MISDWDLELSSRRMESSSCDSGLREIASPIGGVVAQVPVAELAELGICDFEAAVVQEEQSTFASCGEHQLG